MTSKRVRARSAASARKKCIGKRVTPTKVNYIPGTKKSGMKTYQVITKKRSK